jgi:phenylalanyl-tRNA synthetase beta chain
MKFSLNFIQEFLKINLPPKELADKLTMAGMEVEGFTKIADDWVFDIEVTTNRYDWLSMVGIAREISAVLGKSLKVDYPSFKEQAKLTTRKIIIQDKKDCPYYIGRLIEKVKIKESHGCLKKLVTNCGLTSVNDIVDITNYSMLKWGNPLHAFDNDKLEGNIYIRRAKKGESFIGIDNKEYSLEKTNLVIADAKKIIALAGVIGSKNTEVDKATKNVFLEAAIFSPLVVRRSRRLAGLDTESSYRFERRVSPDYLEHASCEATGLIKKIGGGNYIAATRAGKKPKVSSKKIALSLASLEAYLGLKIPEAKVKSIFRALGFSCKKTSANKLLVSSGRERFDINEAVDIYEEISRIYGYEKIKASLPFLKRSLDDAGSRSQDIYSFKNELADYLAWLGFKEIITYSIEGSQELCRSKDKITITNPLRKNENSLRNSLCLGMLKSIKYNLNRNQSVSGFFEIAHTYGKQKESFIETPVLALGRSSQAGSLFSLKGSLENILNGLNLGKFAFVEQSFPGFSNALKIIINQKEVGFLGKLDQALKKDFDLKEDLYFAQLDLEQLIKARSKKSFVLLSPYPAVFRDISISLGQNLKFEKIEEIIHQANPYFSSLSIVDAYKGKDLAPGSQAFTLRVFYQSSSKTLTSGEVDTFHNKIREKLSCQQGIILR